MFAFEVARICGDGNDSRRGGGVGAPSPQDRDGGALQPGEMGFLDCGETGTRRRGQTCV